MEMIDYYFFGEVRDYIFRDNIYRKILDELMLENNEITCSNINNIVSLLLISNL